MLGSVAGSFAVSLSYDEKFNSGSQFSNMWDNNMRISREGYIKATNSSQRLVGAEKLQIINRPLTSDGSLSFHTIYVGRGTKLTNMNGTKTFNNVSEYEPIGFEIIRSQGIVWWGGNIGWPESVSIVNMWLMEDNNPPPVNFSKVNNYVYLFEVSRYTTTPSARWGFFKGTESIFDMTSKNRPDGRNINLTTGAYNMNFTYSGPTANNNAIGMKMTYDGQNVRFFLNPNARGANTYPNEYIYMDSTPFNVQNNLRLMLGHESTMAGNVAAVRTTALYTNILFRTVADTVFVSNAPHQVVTGSTVTFTNFIYPSFTTNDSGIGEILVKKPAEFGMWQPLTVAVSTNGVAMSVLSSGSNVGAGLNQVLVTSNEGFLKIRFLHNNPSSGGVIRNPIPIKISYNLATPSTPLPDGGEFATYVDCVRYNYTGLKRTATTGKKRAYATSGESMVVRAFAQPSANSSISPNSAYQGSSGVEFNYFLATTSTNQGPNVDRVKIQVPTGFSINAVSSLLVKSNCIKITNGNDIILNYAKTNKFISARNGIELVKIVIGGTPSPGVTAWTSRIYSKLPGSMEQSATTNDIYKSIIVRVLPEKPQVNAWIAPDRIYDVSVSNVISYYLENTRTAGVTNAVIYLPGIFTNARPVSSLFVGTNRINYDKTSNLFRIHYAAAGTSIPFNTADIIQLKLFDSIAPGKVTNVDLISSVDNGNGDGLLPATKGVIGWTLSVGPPIADGMASVKTNSIYSTDVTNSFTYSLYNSAVMDGNDIFMAKIKMPASVTNVTHIASLKIADDANYTKFSNGNILLRYFRDVNGRLLRGQLDTITFRIADSISAVSTFTMESFVANTSNSNSYQKTGNYLTGKKDVTVSHPAVSAKAFLTPDNIDSTTETNTFTLNLVNTGKQENFIRTARFVFPSTLVTNIISINSVQILNDFAHVVYNKGTGEVTLDYLSDTHPLQTGMTDRITLLVSDAVTKNDSLTLQAFASNILESQALSAPSGKSLDVIFALPPPDVLASVQPNVLFTTAGTVTNTIVVKVTNKGKGSNNLKKARILLPLALQNKVGAVSNEYLYGTTLLSWDSSAVTIDYTNGNLPAGAVDRIALRFGNTVATPGSNVSFLVYSDNDNGQGYVLSQTNFSLLRRVTFNKQPDISALPTIIPLTSSSNDFTITIRNGSFAPNAKPLTRLRIPMSNPVFVSNNLRINGNVWYPAQTVLSKSSNAILVTYGAGNLLTPGAADQISFNAKDVRIYNETNVAWQIQVDFGDGSGWKETTVNLGSTNTVFLQLPTPTATASVVPASIGTDNETTAMVLTISNTGLVGSDLKLVRITPPSEITNISGIGSLLPGVSARYSNKSIWVEYASYNTNIKAGTKESLSFLAYDRVTNAYTGTWTVSIANRASTNSFATAAARSVGALSTSFFVPTYSAGYYVRPNLIDTSVSLTTFTNVIANIGTGSNNISAAYIDIPVTYFSTNSLIVSSAKATGWSLRTNAILVFYNPSNFGPGQQDTVRITMSDILDAGDASTSFQARVRFTTSAGKYVKASVPTGTSRSVDFVMPAPDVEMTIQDTELYNTALDMKVRASVVNKGKGSNKVTRALLHVPSLYTNNLICNSLQASSNKRVPEGIELYYAGLASSATDKLALTFKKPGTSLAPRTNWNLLVDNGTLTGWASGNQRAVSVESVPSFHIDPASLFSTTPTNTLQVKVYNDGTGDSLLKRAVITLPFIMTNIVSLDSTWMSAEGSSIVRNGNQLILPYTNDPAGAISDAQSDTLTIRFISVRKETNVLVQCSVDNGAGEGSASLFSGKTNGVSFILPANPGAGWLRTSMVYNTVKTNILTYAFRNQGSGNNELLRARINIAGAGFLSLSDFASTKMVNDLSITTNSGFIILDYSSDPAGALRPGEEDRISFKSVHGINNGIETTRTIPCEADNGRGWESLSPPLVPSDAVQSLRFVSPEDASVYWIEGNNVFFTLDTNGSFRLNIGNNSYKNAIEKVRFTFPLDVYTVNSVDSGLIPNDAASVAYDAGNNRITVDYSVDDVPLPIRSEDSILFNVSYHRTTNLPWTIGLEIQYRGAPSFENAAVRVFRTNSLLIKKVTWGRIAGLVKPQNVPTTVKVYYAGTKNLVPTAITDVPAVSINDSISTVSDPSQNNSFVLGFIPPGEYDLEYSASRFYTSAYGSVKIVVNANAVTSIPAVTLMNAPVSASALVGQDVYCNEAPYDAYPFLQIPVNTLLNDYVPEVRTNHLDSEQKADLAKNKYVAGLTQPDSLVVFDVKMFNLRIQDEYQYGVRLAAPITVNVPYNPSSITAQGWSESSLAVYYWDDKAAKWMKVGGKVDPSGNYVTVEMDFLARTYAVFGDNPHKDGPIFDVVVKNNPFTPGNTGSGFGFVTVNFSLEKPDSEVKVHIFNLKGELMRTFTVSCEFAQGSFSWDGLDMDGYSLPAGVYIYQIRSGKAKYTGTVLLAK